VKLLVPLPVSVQSTPAVLLLPLVGVTVTDDDALPVPTLFVARTVQLYATPLVRPETVMGLVLPVAVTDVPPVVQVTV
jgi:hypothetical protein